MKLEEELSKMCNKSTSDCIELAKQLKEAQERIDKAIEHIEESLYILKGDSDIPILTGNVRNRYLKPVLDILRGEE